MPTLTRARVGHYLRVEPGDDSWAAGSTWAIGRSRSIVTEKIIGRGRFVEYRLMVRSPGERKARNALGWPDEFRTPQGREMMRLMLALERAHTGADRRAKAHAGRASGKARPGHGALVRLVLAQHPRARLKAVAKHLREAFGVELSVQYIGQIRSILKVNKPL